MFRHVVGSVPFMNAVPLVAAFELSPDLAPVEVRYEIPSKLPAWLESGEAEAVLVSSVDALRSPGRTLAGGLAIASEGPVLSVRLFSRVPFEQIKTLALDASSMTSNMLAQVVLLESYGVRPELKTLSPEQTTMLMQADACILIGDIGMKASDEGLHVLDLGQAWKELTGLPFLWAGWTGRADLSPELVGYLQAARQWAGCGRRLVAAAGPSTEVSHDDETLAFAARRSGWAKPEIDEYLNRTMAYELDDRIMNGFFTFGQRLISNRLVSEIHLPRVIQA
jgi:chorismate dehydratase